MNAGQGIVDSEQQIRQLEEQLARAQARIDTLLAGQADKPVEDVEAPPFSQDKTQKALKQLRERVKELTLLYHAGQIVNVRGMGVEEMLQAIVNEIPAAWQYPAIAAASIRYGELQVTTPGFEVTPWVQRSTFAVTGGAEGVIEVCYREASPPEDEGPFLAEERAALRALTGILQADLERRQATDAVRHSEARYRELFETMAQGILYQDATGRVIDINPAARRILGLVETDIEASEITNHDINLVREDGSPFPPRERPGRRALRTGEPVYDEVVGYYLSREEGYRWVVVNSIPQFRPGEEKPHQVYSTLEDITERKRVEERHAQLADLVNSSQDAILGVDFEGIIRSWNRGAQKIFGYEPDVAIGRHFGMIAPSRLRPEQERVLNAVRAGEVVESYSTVRLTKAGRRIFVDFSISPILDGTGQIVGVSAIARDVTAQKHAEARLRFQAQLLDSVNEAVVACDIDERIVFWGKGATMLYGHSREEALGRTLRELNLLAVDPESEAHQGQLRTVFEDGFWQGVVRQQRKDGATFWARISLSLVRDRKGRPAGFIGIDRDVTAEVQHERELEAIAAAADVLRTAETLEAVSAAIFAHSQHYLEIEGGALLLLEPGEADYRVTYATGAFSVLQDRLLPLAANGVTGASVFGQREQFVAGDAAVFPFLQSVLAGPLAVACEPLIASNQTLGAMWMGRQERFNESELRLVSSLGDMLASAIQRARYFERLEEQAHQVQRVMDAVEEGLVLLDHEERVLLASPSAVEHLAALGAGEEAMDGQRLVGQRIASLGDRPLRSFLQMTPGSGQLARTAGPQRREFSVAAHPVQGDGQANGWVLVLRDVTEARRTQEMVQQQERLAAVGQLAAGIAHDFNNVMSAIVLYAQILQRRDDLSEKERRRLDVIYRQANHAIELIKQILDFSRRSVMERSAIDLAPFFKEMFRLFDHTLPENINLALQYDEAEYFVMADPTRLQQAITNLAINARDAMPDGGSFIVHLSRLELDGAQPAPALDMKPGAWLQIRVTDSGVGMAPETLQHVFEPFYSTKGPGQGTGLGLAQVYGIISQHDGYILADSVLGRGTTFTIYLPLLVERDSRHEIAVPAISEAEAASGEATLLVVEDEEWARIAMEDALQSLGYRVLAAKDGQQALALFDSHGDQIDLVLSDMVMPEMGGLKLFEQIRTNYPQAKFIIMSGYPLEKEGRALMEQGVVAWINKPFSVNALAAKVAKALKT